MRTSRALIVGVALTMAIVLPAAAFAQLTKDEQKCIDKYNNFGRLVGQQGGTSARACIKNAGKGTETNPDNCIVNNTDGKIAGKEFKVTGLYPSACTGSEPIQQGATANNAAMRGLATNLAHDVFGNPVNPAISTDTVDAKCQDAIILRAGQLATEKLKTFRKCKKDGMKGGAVTDSATLDALCLPPTGIPDPKGAIDKKTTKLTDEANKKCTATTASLATLFPGDCAGDAGTPAGLADCVDERVECRVCLALNAADGTNTNCDLFDDGVADGSCAPVVGGASWYLGAGGASCDATCAAVGKTCDPATITFAGSAGTDGNCQAVLSALGVTAPFLGAATGGFGGGCVTWPSSSMSFRITSPATTCAATLSGMDRACACM